MGMSWDGKVVLVVGASSGIGRAFAVKVAEAGGLLAVSARREAELQALRLEVEAKGGRCLVLTADAMDEVAAAGVVSETVAHYGRVDVALLNVGGAPAIDMRELSAAQVKGYMRTNYDVVVNSLMPCLEQMSRQGSGVVAHTNSLAGFIGLPKQGPYSAAKGALRLLFDTCRLEYADRGITFVSLYPGFVATARVADDGMPATGVISEEEAAEEMVQAIAAGAHDHLFPRWPALQIRLALLAPARLRDAILGRRV